MAGKHVQWPHVCVLSIVKSVFPSNKRRIQVRLMNFLLMDGNQNTHTIRMTCSQNRSHILGESKLKLAVYAGKSWEFLIIILIIKIWIDWLINNSVSVSPSTSVCCCCSCFSSRCFHSQYLGVWRPAGSSMWSSYCSLTPQTTGQHIGIVSDFTHQAVSHHTGQKPKCSLPPLNLNATTATPTLSFASWRQTCMCG